MMMVQLRYSIVSTSTGRPLDRSIFPKDAYSTLQGRRPTVPMEFRAAPWEGVECTVGGREPQGGSHTTLATASLRQWPAHINHNCPLTTFSYL